LEAGNQSLVQNRYVAMSSGLAQGRGW